MEIKFHTSSKVLMEDNWRAIERLFLMGAELRIFIGPRSILKELTNSLSVTLRALLHTGLLKSGCIKTCCKFGVGT